MIRDFNVDWLEKRVWLPAQSAQSQITGAFINDGAAVFQEIGSTLGLSGVQVNQANDAIAWLWKVPYDLDRSKQLRVRAWITKTGTDADAETITVTYSALGRLGVVVDPATALSTTIAAFTFAGTANALEATAWGIISRNTLATTVEFLNWKLASTMTNASADEISLLGIELAYTPRRTAGPRKNILGGRRLAADNPLGVSLHATQEGL